MYVKDGSMAPTRLNREQKQAATRQALLDAATEVFARHGFERAPLEEICDQAGYSRGAFYSNFSSKQQLFMEVLERRTADILGRIATAFADGDTTQQRLDRGARTVEAVLEDDRLWCQLHFEGWVLASRDEDFRALYAQRYDAIRVGVAEMIETQSGDHDLEIGADAREFAAALLALFQGYALQYVIDPDALVAGYFARTLDTLLGSGARGGGAA
jgi:AcrR family transcriptional regulator